MTLVKMRPLSVIVIALFLYCTGCKKEIGQPPREKFTITYQFINEGDENLRGLILSMATFYPYDTVDVTGDSISIINWRDQAFSNIGTYEIIAVPMDKKGYTGCTADLKFRVSLKNPMYSPVYAAKGYSGGNYAIGMTDLRSYVGTTRTIVSPGDSTTTFRWPSDTANYKEVLYY